MNIIEHAIHLAAMVTPKDVSGYHRLKLDNERYLRTELQRLWDEAFTAGAATQKKVSDNVR